MIASGVTPTAYTYTLIICGMAKDFSDSNFVRYAKKYFLEMLDRGLKPQYQPYMYVIDVIAYREPVEEAKKFLEQIKAKGFIPVIDDFQYKQKPPHRSIADIENMLISSSTTTLTRLFKNCSASHASPLG
ncbi:hypothetical protein RchiOBHm_Chr7g0236631 [Rosa chinensis]|uniref:Pentatricopeptide n=1 Tax=Rosa chinensis TaxID=74649 RepID=A0A2P6PGZ7_ROSCH|nr:hypothetical protein RchiOBHm_Chr7g0236631 [Rosa chinensis]